MKEGRLDLREARLIAPAHFEEWTRKTRPTAHDVIVSRRCNPGETAVVPPGLNCALGQNLVILRADGVKVFPPFLRWLARGVEWWEQVASYINVGAVFDSLKCADIPEFRLSIPPLPEQKRIAHILGTLDDKIELNRRMCQTLEEMARALFKSWFVDFDPVRAKAEGRQPAGMDAATAALFPDSFVDSELGLVPRGWETGSFGSFTSQRTERAGVREVVVLSAIASGRLVRSDDHFTKQVYSKETTKYLLVEQWDYAYNPSRVNIGSIGMLEEDLVGGVSPVYVVVRPRDAYRWFLHFSLLQPHTKRWLQTLASGSVRQSLSYYDFASIPSVLPTESVLHLFDRKWSSLRDAIRARVAESDTLVELRDALLPRLLGREERQG
jgi:type I restriction enzyme S subunit